MRFVTAVVLFIISSYSISSATQGRYFTVKDSIEMTRFVRYDPKIVFSPNKKYFAFVTSRGIIRSNTIESTIRVVNVSEVQAFLRAYGQGHPPLLKVAARWSVTPSGYHNFTSYTPVISDVHWLPNSAGLLFLAESSHDKHRLYETKLSSRTARALTPQGYDVKQLVVTRGSIMYEATPPDEPIPGGNPINADSVDLTGIPIETMLFQSRQEPPYNELWELQNGHNRRLTDQRWHLPDEEGNVLSVSPNGRFVVISALVDKVPTLWRLYQSRVGKSIWNPSDPYTTSPFNPNRPKYYVLIDVQRSIITPLLQAPIGLDYLDTTAAVWPTDGSTLLLQNTFLPLNASNSVERVQRLHPCAAAVVELATKTASCVTFTQEADQQKPSHGFSLLIDGSFERSKNEVVLHFARFPGYGNFIAGTRLERRYIYNDARWRLIGSHSSNSNNVYVTSGSHAIHSGSLAITVKQSLNTPPTLWATDLQSHVSKELWNPNPQLAAMSLGEASVFRWQDKTGYTWSAVLLKPPGYMPGKRYPLIIQTHGFDADEFLSDGAYTTAFAARPLANSGMIILQMDYDRDHEVTSQEVPDQIRGFASAIERLTAQGLIDPTRVGIIGFSRTSYHVEGALVEEPKLFTVASITDGIDASYVQYLLTASDSSSEHPDESERIYGTAPFGSGLASWLKAPGFNLDRVEIPLLITAITPPSVLEEWELYASLRMQRKPVDMMYIPNGQHVLQKPLDRFASQQTNVDWFRFWLQGYEDPDPTKAAQYRRWEALRTLSVEI